MKTATILKATALLATGYFAGRIVTCGQNNEATGYTPVRLHEGGEISIWDKDGETEMINVFYDDQTRLCAEYVLSNLQIKESFDTPMRGRDPISKTTLSVRNDHSTIALYTRGLMDDDADTPTFLEGEGWTSLIPTPDGFGDDPWYDEDDYTFAAE